MYFLQRDITEKFHNTHSKILASNAASDITSLFSSAYNNQVIPTPDGEIPALSTHLPRLYSSIAAPLISELYILMAFFARLL